MPEARLISEPTRIRVDPLGIVWACTVIDSHGCLHGLTIKNGSRMRAMLRLLGIPNAIADKQARKVED